MEDNGTGIPRDECENVFWRFYPVDTARSGPGRGTGLGLHIGQRIVEAQGGAIRVEDNPGGGVVFVVILPTCTTFRRQSRQVENPNHRKNDMISLVSIHVHSLRICFCSPVNGQVAIFA